MTRQEALNWCGSKLGQAMDFDGAYGAQCFDFFNFYYQYVTGRNPYADGYGVEGAKDIWTVNNAQVTKTANSPDPNNLPQAGDILIFDGGLSGSGGYGHVAVVEGANASGYTVYEQNWGGMYVKKQYHPWGGHEIGWLTPKSFSNNTGGSAVETVKSMFWRLLGREVDAPSLDHYVKYAGTHGWEFVYNDLKNSPEGQNDWNRRNPDRVTALERAGGEKDRLIADLQVALKNEQGKPPKEVIKEVEKIVEVPVEVIKEVPVYTHDAETKENVSAILKLLKSVWGSLTSLHKKVK